MYRASLTSCTPLRRQERYLHKMAILAASTTNPAMTLQQSSKEIVLTRSTLDFAFRLKQAVGSASLRLVLQTYIAALHVFLRSYIAIAYVVLGIYFATRIIAFQSYLASRFVTIKTALLLSSAKARFWNSPRLRRFRKALEFELFMLLVGPANTVILLLFWPGWIIIGATVWGLGLWPR